MKLSDLLSEDVILLNFSAEDKWEAMDRMLDRLEQLGRLLPGQRTPVRDALVARENIASTGLEHGVALPHATVDVLDKPVAALAISPQTASTGALSSAVHAAASSATLLAVRLSRRPSRR